MGCLSYRAAEIW